MYLLGFALGAILGSFVKAIADRSLSYKSFWGRSYCAYCKKALKWYDLFPVFSYILLKGKCRHCHKQIGTEYLLVEVLMGILVGFLFWQNFASLQWAPEGEVYSLQFTVFLLDLLFKTFFVTVLAILFLTDLKKMFIPDRVVLPAILISIIFITVITIIKAADLYFYLADHPIGKFLLPGESSYFLRHAFFAAAPLWGGILTGLIIAGFFMLLIIITKGKGMGGGDVKLGAFLGLGLGLPNGFLATLLSFLIGAVFSAAAIIFGRKKFGDQIPFGPFLVFGSLISLFWGSNIIDWYLHLSLGS